jgi:hypothetical protein
MKSLLLLVSSFTLTFTGFAQAPHPHVNHKTVSHHAGTKVKVKTKHATGPVVYYCNSGNVVKYHASPGCRGLARCGAAVVPIALASAQQRMDPCKWCY